MPFNVAIVGAGLIGRKRAIALRKFADCQLRVTVDLNKNAAKSLAREFGGEIETDWKKAVQRDDINVVIVATYNKYLSPIGIAALENKKHVLCEKPLGINVRESRLMVDTGKKNDVILKAGLNHRHHPAIAKARQFTFNGEIGELYFLRCRYGHGGRPGYENEWRADKELCGGGELLDQGVHVVDLFRWFAGNFDEAFGYAYTFFWDMKVEDNAFAVFKRDDGVIASMHTSWTQWKNLFSLEVFGSSGYLVVEGLGGSYGIETLKIGKRRPKSGPPDEEILEFSGPDISWEEEWKEFISAIEGKREPIGNGWDGYQANKMIEAVYASARENRPVRISTITENNAKEERSE